MSMMGSVAGTPYSPGSTPSNLLSTDEAAKLMQNAFPPGFGQIYNNGFATTPGTTPSRSTPGYSTPGFSTPGGATPQMDLGDDNDASKYLNGQKVTTNRNFTPLGSVTNTPNQSSYTPADNFTPVMNSFTPVQNNFTPHQNFNPVDQIFTPVDNFTSSEKNFQTPIENFNLVAENSNFTPVENFTPVKNQSFPPIDGFTPDNNFLNRLDNLPKQNFSPAMGSSNQINNGFNPWMQPMPSFPPNNFQPENVGDSFVNRSKNKSEKGHKRKKR